MATKSTLKVLPQGHRIIETSHGNYIQKQKRRVKQYKTTKAHRDAIKRGLRRVYAPVLTLAAIGIPTGMALKAAMRYPDGATRLRIFGTEMLKYYTGIYVNTWNNTVEWKFNNLLVGLGPLVALTAIRRFGVFKGVNQKLARARIPLRLN